MLTPRLLLPVASLLVASLLASAATLRADEDLGPVAHWPLATDARDSSANRIDAFNHGVEFKADGSDGALAATFNGRGAHLEVQDAAQLQLGDKDFSIALWVNANSASGGDPGDLITMYDEQQRTGFNLSLRTSTGVTNSTANVRQLQFGIDNGSEPKWTDEGRPGNAILAFALAVHDGNLYAGVGDNVPGAVGRVYRYAGAGQWIDCGAPDQSNAVMSLCSHDGQLYAASGRYRFAGSSLTESDNAHLGGGVFRYDGGAKWTEVGRLPGVEAVGGMVAFNGRLYASSLYKPAGFFRYESPGVWTALPVPDGKRVVSLAVFDDHLWAGSYDEGRVFRYNGEKWEDLGLLDDNTQTYSFAVHHGELCVGTWPSGRVYRWHDGRWQDLGRFGEELEVMGMLVHNGKFYGGSLPLGAVYRYDGNGQWTKTAQLDVTPDVKYRRAWTMAQFDGRLFCSTLPSGHIHALEAGPCVTYDQELPAGWQHVAAVKRGNVLELYVNGQRVAASRLFDPAKFNLASAPPLQIGAGPGGNFHGELRDVHLYRRALSDKEIADLASP